MFHIGSDASFSDGGDISQQSFAGSPPGGSGAALSDFPCQPCRDSKKKCSKELPACQNCTEAKSTKPCVYVPIPKVTKAEVNNLHLEKKQMSRALDQKRREIVDMRRKLAEATREIAQYGETVRKLQEMQQMVVDRDRVIRQLINQGRRPPPAEEAPSDDQFLRTDFSQLSVDARFPTPSGPTGRLGEERTERVGDGSIESVLLLLFNAHRGTLPGHPSLASLGLDFTTPLAGLFSIIPGRVTVLHHVPLPDDEHALYLFEKQYTYIGTILSFADRPSFRRLLAETKLQFNVADPESCLARAKLLVLMAFGQLYSINQNVGGELPGFQYFAAAVQLLPEVYERPSIRYVETLCLIGYFMQNLNHRSAAFFYVGLAVRMAISLDLHKEIPQPSEGRGVALTEEEREYRRRVWWSVYSLDRILTVKSGNPLMVHDEDITAAMPSPLAGEEDSWPAVVLDQYTQLSHILGRDISRIYKPRSSSTRDFQDLMYRTIDKLRLWRKQIPEQLTFKPELPERLKHSRESVSTMLHFYQCVNMTVRPYLYTLVLRRLRGPVEDRKKDWRENMSDMSQSVVDHCIYAAKDTIRMMTIAKKEELVAYYGYMDTEHAFSAAVILLMVCAAFPPDTDNTASLHSAVKLLGTMRSRGNSHIGTRYLALHRVAAEIAPGLLPKPPASAGGDASVEVDDGPSVAGSIPDSPRSVMSHPQFMANFNQLTAQGPFLSTDAFNYMDLPMGDFLLNTDSMGRITSGMAAPGIDQSVWDATVDDFMRD